MSRTQSYTASQDIASQGALKVCAEETYEVHLLRPLTADRQGLHARQGD